MTIFVDGPTRSPRCGCGSTNLERSHGDGWVIVRFQEMENGEAVLSGRLPVQIMVCRDCMALTFLANLVPADSP